jgi:hypothetical protein
MGKDESELLPSPTQHHRLAFFFFFFGGGGGGIGVLTQGLKFARQALYHFSHSTSLNSFYF